MHTMALGKAIPVTSFLDPQKKARPRRNQKCNHLWYIYIYICVCVCIIIYIYTRATPGRCSVEGPNFQSNVVATLHSIGKINKGIREY